MAKEAFRNGVWFDSENKSQTAGFLRVIGEAGGCVRACLLNCQLAEGKGGKCATTYAIEGRVLLDVHIESNTGEAVPQLLERLRTPCSKHLLQD